MKIALLLCTYNSEKRSKMYEDVIMWWINRKRFDIYVVDSANQKFSDQIETSAKVFHFDQTPLSNSKSQTTLELLSLQQVCAHFGQEWTDNYDYVMKLTAKYILPELTIDFLKKNLGTESYDVVNQFKTNEYGHKNWQNTELVLYNTKKLQTSIQRLYELNTVGDMEIRMWHLRKELKSHNLSKLTVSSKYKRRVGDRLNFL